MAINIQQITDFLLQHKSLSIEKIGTLSVGNAATENSAPGYHFHYDKRAVTTPELYTYIAEWQRKNQNLVRADVDSFFEEARQLMNIGSRPLHFSGVGYIYNDRNEGYKFSENCPVGFKESLQNNLLEQPNAAASPVYTHSNHRKGNGLKIFLFIIILALLVGIGYFLYSLIDKNKTRHKDVAETENVAAEDTALAASTVIAAGQPAVNTGEKKFIFETTTSAERMLKRTTQLRGLGENIRVDTLKQNNQQQYKMYVPIQVSNMKDTTRLKDSLSRYFGKTVTME